jgi:hypothetical protein
MLNLVPLQSLLLLQQPLEEEDDEEHEEHLPQAELELFF